MSVFESDYKPFLGLCTQLHVTDSGSLSDSVNVSTSDQWQLQILQWLGYSSWAKLWQNATLAMCIGLMNMASDLDGKTTHSESTKGPILLK